MSSYKLCGRAVDLEARLEDGEPFVMAGSFHDGTELSSDQCDEALSANYEELWCDLMGSAIDYAHDYGRDR